MMEQVMSYVKPELLIVVFALYALGCFLKSSKKVPDNYIPAILGIVGILICALWVVGTTACASYQDVLIMIFTIIVQGLMVAALAVYGNQCVKQINKSE